MEKENEHLTKALRELSGIKASYEALKEDYEGVKLSLESSERIRRQQKELIGMLRQSQAFIDRGPQTSFISQQYATTITLHSPACVSFLHVCDVQVRAICGAEYQRLGRHVDQHRTQEGCVVCVGERAVLSA
jgi:hypothetical protein